MADTLTYEGCNFFRQRLVLATLSGKSVRIRNIRIQEDDPGLKDFEANFIRLLDKVTNGSRIEVNETGTSLLYKPGLLSGGVVDHDCGLQRSIGFYLEALVYLAPFCKKPLRVTMRGITNDSDDPSVDIIKTVTIPLMKRFIIDDEDFYLKITKRGSPPEGGGQITFSCPVRKVLRPIQLIDPGKIKRIRGLAYATRVSPAMVNRVVDATRGVLNQFISDIYIYTDHCQGIQAGKSSGFGLSLVAETTNGTLLGVQRASTPSGKGSPTVAEDLGKETAKKLLQEVYKGGCVDSRHQSLALLYMAMGQQDVSRVLTGPLTPYTIQFLRHMKDFLGIMFKIQAQQKQDDDDSKSGGDTKVLLSCVGLGFTNVNKGMV
ncbi:predicted protein [Nematostella vectensis]|uniref:RNA 3'-terminal phosphate cyclase-like protein n=1 Tax=Nematostella vectensis TaxID=45351 RepID=A7SYA4_NEMVE|nr:predicted protein [Nematostella vectensis]|eukprot:XP_001623402.1 predicted protein [Nematostella vectensis]